MKFQEINELIKTHFAAQSMENVGGKEDKELNNLAHRLHDKQDLSWDEKGNVSHYTGNGYENINHYLRHGGKEWTEDNPEEEMIPHIDSAIAKHKTKEDAIVYRGISRREPSFIDNGEEGKDPKRGQIIHDKGYVSTTLDGRNKQSASIIGNAVHNKYSIHIAKIRIPKGSNALAINQHGISVNPHEHEVLLPRGSKFKYLRKTKHDSGVTIHHLELLPHDK
jgi:hypothetical protein